MYSRLKIGIQKYGSKKQLFVCKASSSGNRRNPDFSRQSKTGYFRSRNKQFEERDNFDNFEDSDLLSSKNGPLLTLSNAPRSQATAAPGPKEKEIVELFRKVQAQLRERAASKESKKIESSQSKDSESETVNSLLKLLRKHSVEQSKKSDSNNGSRDFIVDQREQNGSFDGVKSSGFSDADSSTRTEAHESNFSSFNRPVSNFRRKSPVPRVKFQRVQSGEDAASPVNHFGSSDVRKQDEPNPETEPEDEPQFKAEAQLVLEPKAEVIDDIDEDEEGEDSIDHGDLSAMKLPELRTLAKSRGIKGYSRMKKGELLEMLIEKVD